MKNSGLFFTYLRKGARVMASIAATSGGADLDAGAMLAIAPVP